MSLPSLIGAVLINEPTLLDKIHGTPRERAAKLVAHTLRHRRGTLEVSCKGKLCHCFIRKWPSDEATQILADVLDLPSEHGYTWRIVGK